MVLDAWLMAWIANGLGCGLGEVMSRDGFTSVVGKVRLSIGISDLKR
jgi:hypothetical protein